LLQHVKELTRENESGFAEAWAVDDAPAGYIQALTNAIVGIEISIDRMEGKWKASQNRPIADRHGVIEGLEKLGSAESVEMARTVRNSLPPE
jgi:transcriptional regulator